MKGGNKRVIALKWKALCVPVERVFIPAQRTVVTLLEPVTFHLLWLKCPSGPSKYTRISIITTNIFMTVGAAVFANILEIIIVRNHLQVVRLSPSLLAFILSGTEMRGSLSVCHCVGIPPCDMGP